MRDVIWSYMTAHCRILLRLERTEREPEAFASPPYRLAGYFDFSELRTDSLIYDMRHHEDSLLNPVPSRGLFSLLLSCKEAYISLLPLLYSSPTFTLIRFRDILSLPLWLPSSSLNHITSLELYLTYTELLPELSPPLGLQPPIIPPYAPAHRHLEARIQYDATWRIIGSLSNLKELVVYLRLPDDWIDAKGWREHSEVVLEPMRRMVGKGLRRGGGMRDQEW
ncbi:hypothetical protein KVT40_007981 [Elsinoe batatas]|uniref:DUF7730 domain-containing protein n=1 Tax=Elsinoe batatas TaxID=2601811 RepID=A0A8K0KW23_9PEZI|nr:hypothetical protein KVT40_007981 [Elsinoe batatas]